jgi:hypothetical protein
VGRLRYLKRELVAASNIMLDRDLTVAEHGRLEKLKAEFLSLAGRGVTLEELRAAMCG